MSTVVSLEQELLAARQKALQLFEVIIERNLIQPGITEQALSEAIFSLAHNQFGIKEFWHKRIVKSGINTLTPYAENPPDRLIEEDDIVFLDFGPVFESIEADYGVTYVLGQDPLKLRLQKALSTLWKESKVYFDAQPSISGQALYTFIKEAAHQQGYTLGDPTSGHLIGHFPHKKTYGNEGIHYICADNPENMKASDAQGNKRHWILEIHLVDSENKIGGFFEDLLTINL